MTTTAATATENESRFVPTIDLARWRAGGSGRADVIGSVRTACETSGFLILVNHGVSGQTIDTMYEGIRRFFEQPRAVKDRIAAVDGDPMLRGYVYQTPRHEQYYYNRMGESDNETSMRLDPRVTLANRWPELPGFRTAWCDYHSAMEDLAAEVMSLLAESLGLPSDWFADKFDRHMSPLTANYYPAQPDGVPGESLRNEAHRDWSVITLLHRNETTGGLQVLDRDDRWVDVPVVPDSFVVNLGRLMSVWTDDQWASTVHRVINPPREDSSSSRISVGFFLHPNPDVVVKRLPALVSARPPRHEPVQAAEFFLRRADKARRQQADERAERTGP